MHQLLCLKSLVARVRLKSMARFVLKGQPCHLGLEMKLFLALQEDMLTYPSVSYVSLKLLMLILIFFTLYISKRARMRQKHFYLCCYVYMCELIFLTDG